MQKLITQQIKLTNDMVEDNEELILLEDENIYTYSFYRRY